MRFNIDKDQIRQEASVLAGLLGERATQASERLSPYIDSARVEAERAAKEAQLRAQPYIDDARMLVVEDYLPRAQRAALAGQSAISGEGTLSERAQRAALAARDAALTVPEPKKKCPKVVKGLGALALVGGAAAAAYVVWRRSQPVEDPWAEEYWEDVEDAAEEGAEEVVESAKG